MPNGTLWIRQNTDVEGSFIGKWVILGISATASYNGASQPSAVVRGEDEFWISCNDYTIYLGKEKPVLDLDPAFLSSATACWLFAQLAFHRANCAA